jgi:hypothetical protein
MFVGSLTAWKRAVEQNLEGELPCVPPYVEALATYLKAHSLEMEVEKVLESDEYQVALKVEANGQKLVLREPLVGFPSEHLLNKLALITP